MRNMAKLWGKVYPKAGLSFCLKSAGSKYFGKDRKGFKNPASPLYEGDLRSIERKNMEYLIKITKDEDENYYNRGMGSKKLFC